MKHENLKARTKSFALRIIKLVESLPKSRTSDVTGRQLMRSGTSVAANYRSSCRARSNADFISKMVSSKKRLTSLFCGWNSWLKVVW